VKAASVQATLTLGPRYINNSAINHPLGIMHPIRSLGMWNCVQVVSDLTNLKSLINLKCNTIKGIDKVPKSREFLPSKISS